MGSRACLETARAGPGWPKAFIGAVAVRVITPGCSMQSKQRQQRQPSVPSSRGGVIEKMLVLESAVSRPGPAAKESSSAP